jgi:uncharacterized protein with HEPN domain
MSYKEVLLSSLLQIKQWLETIQKRAAKIERADDFINSEAGRERLDSICMLFIAVGEQLKVIDHKTQGQLFTKYPQADWYGAMGFRDVIAHQYFQIDYEEVYAILGNDLANLLKSTNEIIDNFNEISLS